MANETCVALNFLAVGKNVGGRNSSRRKKESLVASPGQPHFEKQVSVQFLSVSHKPELHFLSLYISHHQSSINLELRDKLQAFSALHAQPTLLHRHNQTIKMVHLGEVPTDQQLNDKNNVNVAVSELDIEDEDLGFGVPGPDDFSSTVYGSRYAACDLPKHEMPDGEMPRDIAYRMIK